MEDDKCDADITHWHVNIYGMYKSTFARDTPTWFHYELNFAALTKQLTTELINMPWSCTDKAADNRADKHALEAPVGAPAVVCTTQS